MEKRKSPVIRYLPYILILIVLLVSIVFNQNEELTRKVQSGSKFDQSADNFLSENDDDSLAFTSYMWPDDNHVRQEFVPRYNGLTSFSVRIENEKAKEMNGDLVFELRDEEDTLLWSKTVEASKLTDWEYVDVAIQDLPEGVSIKKGKTYSLEIYVSADKETHPYRLYLSGEKIAENKQLYSYGFPMDGQLDIIYSYEYEYFDTYLSIEVIIPILAVALFLLLDWKNLRILRLKKIWLPIMLLVEAGCFVAIVAIVEELSQGNIAKMQFTAILANVCVCAGVYTLILLITNSRSTSMILTAVLLFILALINHYTLLCRGTVLLPSDIYSINTAAAVVGDYSEEIKADGDVLYTFRMLCVLAAGCIWFFRDRNKSKRVISAAVFLIFGFGCYSIFTMKPVQKFLKTEVRSWQMTDRSHKIGFLVNAGECIQYGMLTKPEGYDEDHVTELLDSAETVKTEEDEKPVNIIAIMNESFADLRNVGVENTNEPFLTRYDEIANGDNCVSGKLVMPVYGAGTSCSEFEFLTGCSMLFLSAGNAPYQQYIHDETLSLASYMKSEGYATLAMHPNKATNWCRNTAYPKIGFDRFISITDDEMKDFAKCRSVTDDASFVNLMVRETEETDEDLFEFNVTMQNHGGYDYEGENFQNRIQVEGYDDATGQVSQYLTLVSLTDEAFGNLIDQLKASDEKTLVVMFGDHLPRLPEEFYSGCLKTDSYYLSDLRMYETPYIIWANYDIDMPEVPEVLSANFLAPYVLKAAGEDLTGYYAYLYNLSQQYPIVSRKGIYDKDMTRYTYTASSPCYDVIHDYEMVQYSRLK